MVNRREFLKLLGMAGLTAAMPSWLPSRAHAEAPPYEGPLFITISAKGGWDVTSWCDPKMNTPGESILNHWAENGETRTIAGSAIEYAPVANNQEFFERFHGDMLVVNGIDAETNAHDAGRRHTWSGRLAPGYPSFGALVASIHGQGLPLSYISNGGYRETSNLVAPALVQKPADLKSLIRANLTPNGNATYHPEDELSIIETFQAERLLDQIAAEGNLPRTRRRMDQLQTARLNRGALSRLADLLPDELVDNTDKDGFKNNLLQQAQLALLCYDAGLTVSCDLVLGGFDSHQGNDAQQSEALSVLANGVTYLWDTAEAMGIADRLVVCVGSDFGRGPFYNEDDGKDHWPVGSAIFMKQGASWGGRVAGASDALHNALDIDPATLLASTAANAVRLHPGHVQATLRELAGIADHEVTARFPIDVEPVDLLGA